MSFDTQGFLSNEPNVFREEQRRKFASYFNILESVNTFCETIKYRLEINSEDGRQIIATALFIKLLNDLQGATLLLERGLVSSARSLIRVGLETLFVLANISQHEEFFVAYVESDQAKRLKLLRIIQASTAAMFEDIRPKIKDELIEQLAREVKEKGITENRAERLVSSCGLHIFYDSMYRLFSQDVHSAPKAIEGYCNFNNQSELIGFFHGYEKEDIMPN